MKAAIYSRYSSDNQSFASIDAQIRAIQEYCGKNNIVITKTYIDEAESATNADRPKFIDMVQDSALGIFDAVIVHKLDRFARNRYDAAFYRRKLKENGVQLISVLEPLDNSPESVILESVLEGMAEYYSLNLAREVRKGLKETALKCKHTGGQPALGYKLTPDKKYVVDDREAEAVRLIFSMYIAGAGYNEIISHLHELGYRTKRGSRFGRNSVHDILVNEKYSGVFIYNRSAAKQNGKRNHHASKPEEEIIRIPGGIPAIISEETFLETQKKLAARKMTKGRNCVKVSYMLSGLVICGECGAAMTGATRKAGRNKTEYSYYECSCRKVHKTCDAKPISKEFVENMVLDALRKNVFTAGGINAIVDALKQHTVTKHENSDRVIEDLGRESREIEKKLRGFMKAIADGLYSPMMKSQIEHLELRKEAVAAEITNQKRAAAAEFSEGMIREFLESDAKVLERKTPEDLKRIIRCYVEQVAVTADTVTVVTIVTFVGGDEGSQTNPLSALKLQCYADRPAA